MVSSLRKAVAIGRLSEEDALLCIEYLQRLGIQVIVPDMNLLSSSLKWAARINQRVAYDAQYLALAENLHAELWTADGKLFDKLRSLRVDWVHHISNEMPND